MQCEEAKDQLSRYLEGGLGQKDQQGLIEHLAACTQCYEMLQNLRRETQDKIASKEAVLTTLTSTQAQAEPMPVERTDPQESTVVQLRGARRTASERPERGAAARRSAPSGGAASRRSGSRHRREPRSPNIMILGGFMLVILLLWLVLSRL